MHEQRIIYRDLKPENILITEAGHIKLTDFGFAKRIEGHSTWTICGTPEYMAPEIIRGKGYSHPADWWSFGVLLFEMAAGHPPFEGGTEMEIYQSVMLASPIFPRTFSAHLQNIISSLLQPDLTRRLGCTFMGVEEIKEHPWYKTTTSWTIHQQPPIIPTLSGSDDTSNFDNYLDDLEVKVSPTNDCAGVFGAF